MASPSSSSQQIDFPHDHDISLDSDTVSICETVLPPYASLGDAHTRTSLQAEHVFHLHNRKGKPWATLLVKSARGGAQTSKNLPVFVEGRPIVGSISMDLDSPEHVKTVELIITGQIVTGSRPEESIPFLEHRTCLWPGSSTHINSEATTASSASNNPSPVASESGNGSYHHWPFVVHLPKHLSIDDGTGVQQTYRLPQTLMERNSPVGINYHIAVKVSRRRFHTDSKLITMVSFLNLTRPDPPSFLRQEAYRDHVSLLGPTEDPDGWQAVEPVNICGRVFGDRAIAVRCSLSLATPLSYTRGTVLPLSLTLSCPDPQALDLLSSPDSITVSLIRHIRYTDTPHSSSSRQGTRSPDKYHWRNSVTVCGTACWWPVDGHRTENLNIENTDPNRTLQGEIKLSKYLQPTCDMPRLQLTYTVSINPFAFTGFQPSDPPHKSLLEVPVHVATIPAKGPPARCYAPPEYADHARITTQKLSSTPHWRLERHNLGLVSGMM